MSTPKSPLILDGGMSRELIRLQAPFAQPEWSALSLIQAPEYVTQVHTDFIAAGADIITTNSYALVPFHIGSERFWSQGPDLIALSGRLAREAADAESRRTGRRVLVAGCMPPVFGSYEPALYDPGSVGRFLEVLVKRLNAYVDFWLGETLSVIAEAEAVLVATRGTGKGVWVSFCPDDGEGGSTGAPKLRSGESVVDAARWAVAKREGGEIEALLFNCCRPEFVDAALDATLTVFGEERGGKGCVVKEMPKVGVYANAFVPRSNEYAANEDVSATDAELTPGAYAKMASRWREKGAKIVGGCCGIGHQHIRAVAESLKESAVES